MSTNTKIKKLKILFDHTKDTCPYLFENSWCNLPRNKRCGACITLKESRACEIML
jgi:hypothetical protein